MDKHNDSTPITYIYHLTFKVVVLLITHLEKKSSILDLTINTQITPFLNYI